MGMDLNEGKGNSLAWDFGKARPWRWGLCGDEGVTGPRTHHWCPPWGQDPDSLVRIPEVLPIGTQGSQLFTLLGGNKSGNLIRLIIFIIIFSRCLIWANP